MGRWNLRVAPYSLLFSTFVIFAPGCGTPGTQLLPDQQGGLSGNPLINGAAPGPGDSTPSAGADGANGTNGAAGANGDTGAGGANGSAGSQSSNGATGAAGAQGATGAAGPTGPQGSAGPAGPPGASPFSLVQNNAVYLQGNVGIGTSTPLARLHLAELNDGMSILRIESGLTGSQYAGIDFVDRGKPVWGIGKDNVNDFYVDDHGQRRMTIKSSTGLVGIGAVDPVSRLDVRNGVLSVTNGIAKTRVAVGLAPGVDGGFMHITGPDDKIMAGMGGGVRGNVFVQNAAGAKVAEMAVTPQGQGIIIADVIQAAVKNFCIDHPLDPENKLLIHTSVESSDMMNLYSGNIVTDDSGSADVILPDWFEALNGEFRYQLTPIGQFAQCMVAEKIKGNRFVVRTDKPQVEVSWQVTAVRHDDWAVRNRSPVEVAKAPGDLGKLMRPVAP